MSLARDVASVGTATLASRILAFLRDMWIASLRFVVLVVLTATGLAAYVAALQLFGVVRFRDLAAELRGRI